MSSIPSVKPPVDGEAVSRAVAELISTIDDALDELGGQILDGAVSDEQLNASVRTLHRLETRLHGEKLRRLAECDARGRCLREAAMTTASWLAAQLGLTRGEAKTLAATAAGLRSLPHTLTALCAGQLGTGQAQAAARALDELTDSHTQQPEALGETRGGVDETAADNALATGECSDASVIADAEDPGEVISGANEKPSLEELSEELDVLAADHGRKEDRARLRRSLDEWARVQGSSHLTERERRGFANRRLWLSSEPETDGTVRLEGRLDPLGAAHVRAALDALARPRGDARTHPQRQADALVALAERALDSGELPEVAAQRPHVLLITSPEALHDTPGAEPATLDGYGPVSAATARQLCCDADVTTVSVNSDGTVLNVGRSRRDPNRAQRAAVIARDQRCIGCHAPATRCQIHHRHWWRNGGSTDLDNLVLTCWSCHHHLHHAGWQITRRGNSYTAHPPDLSPPRETIHETAKVGEPRPPPPLWESVPSDGGKGRAPVALSCRGSVP